MSIINHNVKVINFSNNEAVTYPIIKIIGTVQYATSVSCQIPADRNVYLTLENNTKLSANMVDNKFKFLVELGKGKNQITIKYCCETIDISLEYFSLPCENAVIPLYVICDGHDGCFQAPPWENNGIESACQRITLGSKLLQCVTAEKLHEHGLGRKTFSLESECQIFRSKLNYIDAENMSQLELWEHIGREILQSDIGAENKKYLAFLSCTKYCSEKYVETLKTHEDLLSITRGYVALGGGGLALFGTACLYTWPEKFEKIIERFEDPTLVDRTRFLDDSCYRGTIGACFSTTLGSVLHELYHTFDLGHTEDGIMGRGFDNIYKVFTKFDLSTNQNMGNTIETKNTFLDKIEFKEKLEPESLAERLQSQKRKKEFTVIKKFEEVDDTVLSKSCAAILCYHRCFNQVPSKQSSLLSFDSSNKLIKSTSGIRVIEIRIPNTEFVIFSWVFDGRILKFSFQIPQEVIIELCDKTNIIFVEDTIGSILKESFRV
nr:putative zinc metalloproteinase YIL108W [Leptinotarsa decemlineata]